MTWLVNEELLKKEEETKPQLKLEEILDLGQDEPELSQ